MLFYDFPKQLKILFCIIFSIFIFIQFYRSNDGNEIRDPKELVLKEDGRMDLNYVPAVPNSFLLRRSKTPSPVRERREREG